MNPFPSSETHNFRKAMFYWTEQLTMSRVSEAYANPNLACNAVLQVVPAEPTGAKIKARL